MADVHTSKMRKWISIKLSETTIPDRDPKWVAHALRTRTTKGVSYYDSSRMYPRGKKRTELCGSYCTNPCASWQRCMTRWLYWTPSIYMYNFNWQNHADLGQFHAQPLRWLFGTHFITQPRILYFGKSRAKTQFLERETIFVAESD
jgi:hypothetical protein